MDSSGVSGLLPFLIIVVILLLTGKIMTQFSRQQNERHQRETWQRFAQESGLRFIPTNFFDNSIVRIGGQYRDYNIELFTTNHQREVNEKAQYYMCTHAKLFFESRNLNDEEIAVIEGSVK